MKRNILLDPGPHGGRRIRTPGMSVNICIGVPEPAKACQPYLDIRIEHGPEYHTYALRSGEIGRLIAALWQIGVASYGQESIQESVRDGHAIPPVLD